MTSAYFIIQLYGTFVRCCHWLGQVKSQLPARQTRSAIPLAPYVLIPTKMATDSDRNSGLAGQVLYLDVALHVAVPAVRFRRLRAVFQERVVLARSGAGRRLQLFESEAFQMVVTRVGFSGAFSASSTHVVPPGWCHFPCIS